MKGKSLFYLLLWIGLNSPVAGSDPGLSITSSGKIFPVWKFSRYYYSSFEPGKGTTLTIHSEFPVTAASVSPLSTNIPANLLNSNTIKVSITKPGHYLLRINDTIKLFLFARAVSRDPDGPMIDIVTSFKVDNSGKINETLKIQKALDDIAGTDKTLYFPAGIYKAGQLFPRSNSRIHLAEGAVLEADTSSVTQFFPGDDVENRRFIYLKDVENVKITGNGTINGNGSYLRTKFGDDARIRLLLAVNSKNIHIEGLMLKDPGSWNTQLIKCNGVTLRNLKLLNDIDVSNTDGFDPDASENILIENCFAYCGDDNVAVKVTGRPGLVSDVNNIVVKGCVFLTKKSALKVGTETRTKLMSNITFENNDILECDRGMSLYVYDGATLDNIKFVNNRFERNHPDAQKKAIHFEVKKRNPDSYLGSINNVLIKDCTFYSAFPDKSVIDYSGSTTGINVVIRNLSINGKKAYDAVSAGIIATNSTVTFIK